MNKRTKLLLVEDDADDVLLFRRRCPENFVVDHVCTPEAAMEALRREAYDVCFTDYALGRDTGLDLLRHIRAAGLRLPLIMITGQDVELLGENALLAGATDFVVKDGINAAELQRVVRWAMIRRLVEMQREGTVPTRPATRPTTAGSTASMAVDTLPREPSAANVVYLFGEASGSGAKAG